MSVHKEGNKIKQRMFRNIWHIILKSVHKRKSYRSDKFSQT